MRKRNTSIILLIFICFSLSLKAQFLRQGASLGVTFSGLGVAEHFTPYTIGDSGYDGKGYVSLGIIYIRPLSNSLDIETAVEYSRTNFRHVPLPEEEMSISSFYVSFVDVSTSVRFNFWEYFFFNGGALLSTDVENTRFKKAGTILGAGVMLGAGAKYDFKNTPIGLFFNPYVKHRSILSILDKGYAPYVAEFGFRAGVVYNF
jgi:hypothetical protein